MFFVQENVLEIFDVLTLLTGLFHKSESADLKSKWKLTRTYSYHLHHHYYIAQIAWGKYLRWFFVMPCLDCLQSWAICDGIRLKRLNP